MFDFIKQYFERGKQNRINKNIDSLVVALTDLTLVQAEEELKLIREGKHNVIDVVGDQELSNECRIFQLENAIELSIGIHTRKSKESAQWLMDRIQNNSLADEANKRIDSIINERKIKIE